MIPFLDVTSLNGTDSPASTDSLLTRVKGAMDVTSKAPAALCVFPAYVAQVRKALKGTGVKTAAVAAGFPHALSPLESRIQEVRICAEDGAQEVDVVIRRSLANEGYWEALFDEVSAFKEAAGALCFKAILEAVELETPEIIFKAAELCVRAGCDFVKTSTGKASRVCTPDLARPIFQAIKGTSVGFKAAGGIQTIEEARAWQDTVRFNLGEEWLCPERFRIGASGLFDRLIGLR